MGLLLDGPIESINYNVEQVVKSLTCMYAEMKRMACRYEREYITLSRHIFTCGKPLVYN